MYFNATHMAYTQELRNFVPVLNPNNHNLKFSIDMKKTLILALAIGAAFTFSSCKSSREAAYRQAYEKAQAQENANKNEAVAEVTETKVAPVVTPVVTPVQPTKVSNADVRTIQGEVTVVSGDALKTYSVVVGSFLTQANAEALKTKLCGLGHAARVVRTNETINGQTGWYRVIASSFDDKATAAQLRDELISDYEGAWLLYRK